MWLADPQGRRLTDPQGRWLRMPAQIGWRLVLKSAAGLARWLWLKRV